MVDQNLENKPKRIPVLAISRKVIQIIFFFLINYVALETIFNADFSLLEDLLKVLPFLHSAKSSWTVGAGLLEYSFYTISEGHFPFFFIAVISLLGLFGGRIFCGWACPTGFIQDLLYSLSGENKRFSLEVDRSLKKVKFFGLIAMIVLITPLGIYRISDVTAYIGYADFLGDLTDNMIAPISLSEFLFVTFPGVIQSIIENVNLQALFSEGKAWSTILFFLYIIILVLNVFWPRAYCKYLCPYGAAISFSARYSLVKLQRKPTRCPGRKECGVCEKVCPMQIRILDEDFSGFTGKGECTLCLECMEKCPHDAIKWRFGA
ncbi:4Fe-4S binding protein [Promethearchaeum syntrophicum]|uniref:4Fe-4S binding protein n=1 Tax=Promethearchaeum syntrophicum TaxID=2594042 RepID=A0A5B9D8V5_9ARCH|nr:4Fe-4S binding protein [Candidatus Prometheoarchaeum syntrophicum]QEE15441.1 Ferredoxin [Candidatus Prometheoarchaeum syntrophicum]